MISARPGLKESRQEQEGLLEGRFELFFEALQGGGSWRSKIIDSIASAAGILYSTTNLHGATTTHSSLNANAGINVGSGQTISNPGTMHIEAAGNLYLKPWAGGGQVVVGGGGGNGNLTATGRVTANGSQALTGRSDNWSVIARDSAGGLNNAAKNSAGSIHANDVYVRSVGKWVSDIAATSGVPTSCYDHAISTYYTTGHQTYQCPWGYVMRGMRYAYWKNGIQTQTHLVCCK